jgi:hypothetical protein
MNKTIQIILFLSICYCHAPSHLNNHINNDNNIEIGNKIVKDTNFAVKPINLKPRVMKIIMDNTKLLTTNIQAFYKDNQDFCGRDAVVKINILSNGTICNYDFKYWEMSNACNLAPISKKDMERDKILKEIVAQWLIKLKFENIGINQNDTFSFDLTLSLEKQKE